jgi:carbamoyl-phosphate synthase large subunit
LPGPVVAEIRKATVALAKELGVVGLMNVQFAVKQAVPIPGAEPSNSAALPVLYVLEVNPRASRTVPFVSKATGMPAAKIAAKVMAGVSLAQQGVVDDPIPRHVSVKESVFPFIKFRGVDIVLGPEMRSTGEVMGISPRFSMAFAKAQLAAGCVLPTAGSIFLSVAPRHKARAVGIAKRLVAMGFNILATRGTADALAEVGIEATRVKKLKEGQPNLIDYMADGVVSLVMNTPVGKGARTDEGRIRAAAVSAGVPCLTTMEAAEAATTAIEALRCEEMQVMSLQERFA